MFRILIADDEGIMRESLKNTIKSNFGSECEIITVKTGREIIEQAESFRPDIAFVDIQMPGLSGIQAIQEVQKFNKSIVFIIITAYDSFSYAQEAVNLGVMEYVMKPINKQKVVDVCVKAMTQVENARKKRSDDLKTREKLEIVIPMIETAFINNLLQDDETGKGRSYLEMLDIQKEFGYIMVLEFGDSIENGSLTNALGSNVRMNKSYSVLYEMVRSYMDCIVGPIMGNRIVIYVPCEKDRLVYDQRVEAITRIRNMIRKLEENLDLKFRVGIGDVKIIDQAYSSYREAVRSIQRSDKHVVHIMDLSAAEEEKGNTNYPTELKDKYIQLGIKGDQVGAADVAIEIVSRFEMMDNISFGEIKMKLMELVLSLEHKAQESGTLSMETRKHESYLTDVASAGDMAAISKWFVDNTKRICNEINTSKQERSESVVGKAIKYINQHFAEDINLDDVARTVDISPYYFSKLFKQEAGENFIEYLTHLRMKQAKEYLANPQYSIKEVCIMCGYSDPNYFSRIFKKYEGVSPTEFRG